MQLLLEDELLCDNEHLLEHRHDGDIAFGPDLGSRLDWSTGTRVTSTASLCRVALASSSAVSVTIRTRTLPVTTARL